ncbi:MAG TPA: MFS transporter [Candidatus Dormibacteraeota bacterium]|nr:MFS transporter [Candidatus Dormibacteraeota bacterium]
MPTRVGTQHTSHARRLRWLALIVLCGGGLMMVLDTTIVNVALPSIERDLRFSQASLAWIVNAYLVPFGGLLLLAGRLADLIGRKRMFLVGLTVFTAASLLGGLSGSQGLLVGARLVQGVGAAMAMTVILGIIVTTFGDPREQARAIGVFSFTTASGASIGLLAGGLLAQAVSWHWIFFVNVPIGVAAVLLAARLVETDPGSGLRRGADVAGALLVTSALVLGVYTIVETTDAGWGSARTVSLGMIALVLLVGFLVRQVRASHPLLPLGLFRSRSVSGANLVQVLMMAGLFGMFFLGALYMQGVLGYDPIEIGLAFLPMAAVIAAFGLGLAAELNTRFGARRMLVVGLAMIVVGLALLTRAPVEARYAVDVLPAMVLSGVGFGLTFPGTMTLGMSGATSSDSGLLSGLLQTSSQVGGSLGLAVLAAVSTSRTNGLLAAGQGAAAAFTDGYHLAFAAGTGVVALAIVVAVAVPRSESVAAARTTDEREQVA